MLTRWLFRGELNDPYSEFMIQEDLSISRDTLAQDFNAQYWENRYTLRTNQIPKLLHRVAAKALTAGKYLNVVRGLGDQMKALTLPAVPQILFDLSGDHGQLYAHIDSAYTYSSKVLLQILEDSYGVYIHLRSLRRFFLLENGTLTSSDSQYVHNI
jgi:gamma-tubulin complex component 2